MAGALISNRLAISPDDSGPCARVSTIRRRVGIGEGGDRVHMSILKLTLN